MTNTLKYFVAVAAVYLTLLFLEKESIAWYFKPILLPFLILAVNDSKEFATKKWLVLALIFSWIGDVILMFANRAEIFFILGLLSFLIAHILFIVLFIKQNQQVKPLNKILFAVAVVLVSAYLFGMLTVLFPSLGDLKIPVSIYAFTISLMLIMAIRGALTWQKPMNLLIFNGAFAFVTSDSLLAINKFHNPIAKDSFLIMITYLVAQYLITLGILKLNEKNSLS